MFVVYAHVGYREVEWKLHIGNIKSYTFLYNKYKKCIIMFFTEEI